MKRLVSLLLGLSFMFSVALMGAGSTASDLSALQELYKNYGGTNWKHQDGWKQSNNFCSFYGVTCRTISGQIRVVGLNLSNNNLRNNNPLIPSITDGTIPTPIFKLSALEILDLSRNNFANESTVQDDIKKLTYLKKLILRDCKITYISEEVGKLPNLTHLSLSKNRLKSVTKCWIDYTSGGRKCSFTSYGLPENIGNLSKLTSLDLSYNYLQGEILPFIEKLKNLKYLSLSHNQLGKPFYIDVIHLDRLQNLTNLIELNLSYNALYGEIPDIFGRMYKLEFLRLNHNEFIGNIPTNLVIENRSLRYLTLAENRLSGSIPGSILKNKTFFQTLDLRANHLAGPLPEEFNTHLRTITALGLHNNCNLYTNNDEIISKINSNVRPNYIDDNFPSNTAYENIVASNTYDRCGTAKDDFYYLRTCQDESKIHHFNEDSLCNNDDDEKCGYNKYNDNEPRITGLRLSTNHYCYDENFSIENFSALESVDIYSSTMTEDIGSIDGLIKLKHSLKTIKIQSDKLTNLPSNIGDLLYLETLVLDTPNLKNLPYSISKLKTLKNLTLKNTHLASLSGLGELENLQNLTIENATKLKSLPSNLEKLTKLQNITFKNTPISQLPNSLINAKNLTNISITNSAMKSVPAFITSLTNLKTIRLNGNSIASTIPADIGNLVNLETLDLSSNNITGTIPKSIGNIRNLKELYLNNNSLYGTIPQEITNLLNLDYINLYHNSYLQTQDVQTVSFINYGCWQKENVRLSYDTILSTNKHLDDTSNMQTAALADMYQSLNVQRASDWFSGDLCVNSWRNIECENGNISGIKLDYYSQAEGKIPTSIGSLTTLKNLEISYVTLGKLPSSIGNLRNLEKLKVDFLFKEETSSTKAQEPIPQWITNLTKLKELDLSGGNFTGRIPSGIGNLANLETLDLSYNKLTGNIPTSFANLSPHLDTLRLNDNKLSGEIDERVYNSLFNEWNSNIVRHLYLENNCNLTGNEDWRWQYLGYIEDTNTHGDCPVENISTSSILFLLLN